MQKTAHRVAVFWWKNTVGKMAYNGIAARSAAVCFEPLVLVRDDCGATTPFVARPFVTSQ